MSEAIEKLQKMDNDIQKAKTESDIYERQLKELLPSRKQMEQESLDKYGCKIDELPAYKQKIEDELEVLVEELEKSITEARGDAE